MIPKSIEKLILKGISKLKLEDEKVNYIKEKLFISKKAEEVLNYFKAEEEVKYFRDEYNKKGSGKGIFYS